MSRREAARVIEACIARDASRLSRSRSALFSKRAKGSEGRCTPSAYDKGAFVLRTEATINAELAHAEPASERCSTAAARLAARHAEMCERDVNVVSQNPATPSWFKLFREIDADGSGLIDYSEFESMVREMLNLDEEEVAERSLMAAWLVHSTPTIRATSRAASSATHAFDVPSVAASSWRERSPRARWRTRAPWRRRVHVWRSRRRGPARAHGARAA